MPAERRFPKVLLAAALLLTIFPSTPASAQFGELAGFTEAMHPEYLNRDLVIFADALELDKSQKEVLESFYADYRAAFAKGLDDMQQQLRAMKEELRTGDQRRILQKIFVPFEEWARGRRKLGKEFIHNLEIILNEQQQELLPAFHRRLVREKTLSRGVLSGESVNLFVVVLGLRLSQPAQLTIDPIMADYEMHLHDALTRRNKLLEEAQSKTVEALQNQDISKNIDVMERQISARKAVREVNDRFIDLIAATLPEQGGEFYLDAMTKAYSKAYRTSPAERMFADAVKLDLETEILESIIDLRDLYLAELELFRRDLVDVIREYEPKRELNRVEMFAARMAQEKVVKLPDPTLAEIRKRDRLDDQYIELLQALLTPEEFATLSGAQRWMARKANKDRAQGEKIGQRDRARADRKRPGPDALRGMKSGSGKQGGLGPSAPGKGSTGGQDR